MSPLPVNPTVTESTYEPVWLIDLTLIAVEVLAVTIFQPEVEGFQANAGFRENASQTSTFVPIEDRNPFLFSDRYIDTFDPPYLGRLLGRPVVTSEMRDTFWGTVEVSDIQIELANTDELLTPLFTKDIRGLPFIVMRYDMATETVLGTYPCTVQQVAIDSGRFILTGSSPNLDILEQEIPKGTVTNEVFGERVVDRGATIPVVLGEAKKIQLPYIHDGVSNNHYDYLVGYGELTVNQVYRDGPKALLSPEEQDANEPGPFIKVTSPEYIVSQILYPGYTVIRFRFRQRGFSGQFHTIYADVAGDVVHTNFARAIQEVLENAEWGLGQVTDSTSFNQAAADLDAIPFGGLVCSGAIVDQDEAQNVLNELMIVRGMRLGISSAGLWTLFIDKPPEAVALHAGGSQIDDNHVILRAGPRSRKALKDSLGVYTFHYGLDLPSGEYKTTVERTVTEPVGGNSPGQDRSIENRFVQDIVTADKAIDYLAKRERFGADTCSMTLGQEAAILREGDLVEVTYPPLNYVNAVLQVRRISIGLTEVEVQLSAWSEDIYDYDSGPGAPLSVDINDIDNRVPVPSGLQLGPLRRAVHYGSGATPPHLPGAGNDSVWRGSTVRFKWRKTVPIVFLGADEDNLGIFLPLVRDYIVTIIGEWDVGNDV